MKIRARKRFGQHFLVDLQVLQAIMSAIAPQLQDHMVEVGPGHGALTDHIAGKVARLDLVEIDRDCVAALKDRYPGDASIHIHQADVLNFDWHCLDADADVSLRVVGNLPYNISTPLLTRLLFRYDTIKDMHFLLQKEVAERLCAPVGDKHYGRLTVLAQLFCQPQLLFLVEPHSFNPCPRVMSAFTRLTVRDTPLCPPEDIEGLMQLVKLAFVHRRKTLANNLKSVISADTLSAIGVDPMRRPQQLSIDEFIHLHHHIKQDKLAGASHDT